MPQEIAGNVPSVGAGSCILWRLTHTYQDRPGVVINVLETKLDKVDVSKNIIKLHKVLAAFSELISKNAQPLKFHNIVFYTNLKNGSVLTPCAQNSIWRAQLFRCTIVRTKSSSMSSAQRVTQSG